MKDKGRSTCLRYIYIYTYIYFLWVCSVSDLRRSASWKKLNGVLRAQEVTL